VSGDERAASIRRPLTLSFGASVAVQAMNVLTGVLLARTLGPHGRGDLAAVILWPSAIASIGGLGVAEATTFYLARQAESLASVLGTSLALAVAQSAICVCVGAALTPVVLSHFGDDTVRAAYVFLAFIPANLITLTLMSALNGLQRFGEFQALRLSVIALTCVSIGGLRAADELTVMNVTAAYIGANIAAGLLAFALVARAGGLRFSFRRATARRLVTYGIKSHTSSVTWMMNERLDQLVISMFLAPAKLGLYVTAVTMTSLVSLVGSSVSGAAFPVVAKLRTGRPQADAMRRFVRLSLIASAAVALPLIVAAPAVIDVFFKDAYGSAANVSRVLMVAAVVLSTNRALGACLKAMNRPLDAGIGEALALAVTAGGLAALLPLLGIMGAAVVSLAAYVVSTAWMARRAAAAIDSSVWSLLLPGRAEYEWMVRRPWPRPALRAGDAVEP